MSGVEGWTDPRFDRLIEAFQSNVSVGEESDAQLAVVVDGVLVADLSTAGSSQALYPVFSVSKAITASVLLTAQRNGHIDPDAPVARYWPEFAAAGKGEITVRQVAAHRAGLPAFDLPMGAGDLLDWNRCVDSLAAQTPRWAPGTAHGYHAVTVGYLLGEVIRRATGQTVGAAVAEHFATPLDLELWIGLPAAQAGRVHSMIETPGAPDAPPGSLESLVMGNPPVTGETFGRPDVWAAEVPGVNAIADARSLATFLHSLIGGDRSFTASQLNAATRPVSEGIDLVLTDQPTRFGTGFLLPNSRVPMLSRSSFGHDGRGGALAFADRAHGVGFAYVTSRANLSPAPDRRHTRLLAALRDSLDGVPQ